MNTGEIKKLRNQTKRMTKQMIKFNENGVVTTAVKEVIDSFDNLNKSLEMAELSHMFEKELEKQNVLQQEINTLEIPSDEDVTEDYKIDIPQDMDFMMMVYRYLKITTEQMKLKQTLLRDAHQLGCIFKPEKQPKLTEMNLDVILNTNKFQCVICLSSDVPMSQICYFAGCSHYSCMNCVNGLRNSTNNINIIRCPTCRRMISHIVYPTKIGDRATWTCELATPTPTTLPTGAYTSLDIIYNTADNSLSFYDLDIM